MQTDLLSIILYIFLFASLYFEVLILLSFFEGLDKMKEEEDFMPLSFPSVLIVVPVWNEEKTLAGTINSLLDLNYPKDKLTIMMIDDGSTDNTLTIMQTFAGNKQIEIYTKENGGKHTAVNFALSKCKAELFGCLDADSFVEKNTLLNIVKYFEDKEVMAVTPSLKVKDPKTLIQKMQAVEYTMGIFLKKVFGNLRSIQVTPGPFSIFRKTVFDELGPYKKAHNTEDFEIALRMHRNHMLIVNSHKAFVLTQTPETVRKLIKQRLRWTQGSIENLIDYKDLFFKKEYGNFGIIILPFIFFFVFLALFTSFYMVFNLIKALKNKAEYIYQVGIDPFNFSFKFDSFFISTEAIVFLSILFILITLTTFTLGRVIAEEKTRPSHLFYFLTMYTLIVPIWMWRSVFNVITKKKNTWR
jgi:cellulose synthase/poly-beta-1,6-N-acetylglucosamine synthase-like glycosyltransferase